MRARKLRHLAIDDNLPVGFEGTDSHFSCFFDIAAIRTWVDTQFLIEEGTWLSSADIITIDVSMETDRTIAKAVSSNERETALPVGPMLALPFITNRLAMSCVVYSGHFGAEGVETNPIFLLAVGLLAARTHGVDPGKGGLLSRHLADDPKHCQLDEVVREYVSSNPKLPGEALSAALVDYRDTLENRIRINEVTLVNSSSLLSRIQSMRRELAQGIDVVVGDDFALKLVSADSKDCIDLRSIGADMLKWKSKYANIEFLDTIEEMVNAVEGDCFSRALEVIRSQEPDQSGSKVLERRTATDVVKELYGASLDKMGLTEVLRTVVLLSNVYALANPVESGYSTAECVFERLGIKSGQNTYLSYFGRRKLERSAKTTPRGIFSTLDDLTSSEDNLQKCFLIPKRVDKSTEKDTPPIFVSQRDFRLIERYCNAEDFTIPSSIRLMEPPILT